MLLKMLFNIQMALKYYNFKTTTKNIHLHSNYMRKVLVKRRISSMRTGRAGHLGENFSILWFIFIIRKCLYRVPASCDRVHTCTALRSTSGKMYKITQTLMCLFKSTCHSELAARHAGRVVVPHLVVWHSFHISSLTPSCIFTYSTFPFLSLSFV